MTTVDLYAGGQTVRHETPDLWPQAPFAGAPAGYRDIRARDSDFLLCHAVRGYRLVRYLQDLHSGVLAQFLTGRHDAATMTRLMATATGVDQADFWQAIDRVIVDYSRGVPHRDASLAWS